MATQRITLAKIVGDSGAAIHRDWTEWCAATGEEGAVTRIRLAAEAFVERLKSQATAPPVVYFAEWIDRWSFSDDIFGSSPLSVDRYEIACLTPDAASTPSKPCRARDQEHRWLAARLRECAESWHPPHQEAVTVLVRELLGPSVHDREIEEASRDAAFVRSSP